MHLFIWSLVLCMFLWELSWVSLSTKLGITPEHDWVWPKTKTNTEIKERSGDREKKKGKQTPKRTSWHFFFFKKILVKSRSFSTLDSLIWCYQPITRHIPLCDKIREYSLVGIHCLIALCPASCVWSLSYWQILLNIEWLFISQGQLLLNIHMW